MATAKIVDDTVTVTKKVKRIQLTLTEGEADFLTAILCRISGDEVKSPRKYQRRITDALYDATGLDFTQADAYPLMDNSYFLGGIHFSNYPKPRAGSEYR